MRSRLRYGIVGGSGLPFSLTREMSIRFFGYFASKQRANCAPGTFQISLSVLSLSQTPALLIPGIVFTGTVSDAPFDPGPGPILVFLTLLFGYCLSPPPPFFRSTRSPTLLSRKLFGFPLRWFRARSRVHARPTENLSNEIFGGTNSPRPRAVDVSSFGWERSRPVLRRLHSIRKEDITRWMSHERLV